MDKTLLRIPKNLTSSKIKISLLIIFYGGALCFILIVAFKDKASLILALLSIFPCVGLYYSVLYFIRERQLLFDDEGIHNVYKQKGERIVESIPWNQITKIEYWGNYGGKRGRGDTIVVHYHIPRAPFPYHSIGETIHYNLGVYFSFEGFRIISPKYVPRIKKGLEQICKDKHIQFVLT